MECTGPKCTREATLAGLCQAHWRQQYRGKPLTVLRVQALHPCKVDNCKSQSRSLDLCTRHLQQYKAGKPFTVARVNVRQYKKCLVVGCDNDYYTTGMCRKCYDRFGRYGFSTVQVSQLVINYFINGCFGCGDTDLRKSVVDHNHNCCPTNARGCAQCFRGLICSGCNMVIGHGKDNASTLRRMALYLEDNK